MLARFRAGLSFANVVSLLALFVALGGSAYAVTQLDRNSVRSKHLVNQQVKRADLAKNAVNSSRVKDESLTGADVDEATLGKVGDSDTLDGRDAGQFIQGLGSAVKGRGAVDVTEAQDPFEVTDELTAIPGFGVFEVRGSLFSPGNDCAVTFTNTSGVPVFVNGVPLADGAKTSLVGVDSRPSGAHASFILTTAPDRTAAGQIAVTFSLGSGFPCSGSMLALSGD